MPFPNRIFSGVCEISTGTLTVTNAPPSFTGEKGATSVEIDFQQYGQPLDISSSDIGAEMYFFYPDTDEMSQTVQMDKMGSKATASIPDTLTIHSGAPLLTVRLLDKSGGVVLVACSIPVTLNQVTGERVLTSRPATPSEIVYIGRAPYVGENGHWMVWDNDTAAYVDSGKSSVIEGDGVFLPVNGKALDSSKLGGILPSGFLRTMKFSKVKEIILPAETTTVEETLQKKYKHLIATVECPVSSKHSGNETAYIGFRGNNPGSKIMGAGVKYVAKNEEYSSCAYIICLGNIYKIDGYHGTPDAMSTPCGPTSCQEIRFAGNPPQLDYVTVYTFGAPFPKGMKITIYGSEV